MINISISTENMDKAKPLFQKTPQEVKKAALRAINRTLTSMRKETLVNVRKQYIISAKSVKGLFYNTSKSGYVGLILLMTLVWLYLEILRLVQMILALMGDDN